MADRPPVYRPAEQGEPPQEEDSMLMHINWLRIEQVQFGILHLPACFGIIEVNDYLTYIFLNISNTKMPTLPTLCITGKLDRCVTHYFRNCTLTWVSPSPGISYIFSTGWARLIRSLSSARISFELSGNLN